MTIRIRLPRLSLAVKYRVLFGLAVGLIIAAALYVPWYLLDALVLEPVYRDAERLADDYFRQVLASPAPDGMLSSIHGQDVSMLPGPLPREPRFVPFERSNGQPATRKANDPLDEFVAQALKTFGRRSEQLAMSQVERSGEESRFFYAHAVRVTRSCLNCHDEGRSARPYKENDLAGAIAVELSADSSDQTRLFYRLALIAAGGLAGILAILVFYIIMHRFILAPIEELRNTAIQVGEGRLEVRAHVETGDEFEHLANTLNNMLERLRLSQDELRRANKLLDARLGEMGEINVALHESNRVKSEFLANVSHELRTPLTSIIGFAELIREGPLTEANGRVARYSENILISGRILLEIINDLLDLAKIEAGRVELRLVPIRLEEICNTLIDFMRPLADKKNLQLTCDIEADLPLVTTDRGRLRQILFNLLSNAVKFTPDGGSVGLRARRNGDTTVRIEVSDTGPGVAAEHHAVIFEKFRQIDQSETREFSGTGLGLAIARELTVMLGGTIGVESELGSGATFWIVLPLNAPESAERPAATFA